MTTLDQVREVVVCQHVLGDQNTAVNNVTDDEKTNEDDTTTLVVESLTSSGEDHKSEHAAGIEDESSIKSSNEKMGLDWAEEVVWAGSILPVSAFIV